VAVREREGQLVRPLACNLAAAPQGYERVQSASLGAFAVYAALARVSASDEIPEIGAAWHTALQWRQDSLTVFTNDEGHVAVSWRMLFEDSGAAAVVANRLYDPTGQQRDPWLISRGAEVEMLAAEGGTFVREYWQGTDPEACPEAE
jgi:hypothetical protein